MEWQPIETAPRDGTNILILAQRHPEDHETSVYVGFRGTIDGYGEDDVQGWCDWGAGMDDDGRWYVIDDATHWMPLPSPPA